MAGRQPGACPAPGYLPAQSPDALKATLIRQFGILLLFSETRGSTGAGPTSGASPSHGSSGAILVSAEVAPASHVERVCQENGPFIPKSELESMFRPPRAAN